MYSPIPSYRKLMNSHKKDAQFITLVHGVSQDHHLFDKQIVEFQSDYNLMLIDLPGHGLSDNISGPYGLQEYADAIFTALTDANIKTSHFWGTHLGAASALLLACQKTAIFNSLILEAPVYPGRPLAAVSDILVHIKHVIDTEGIEKARDVWWNKARWFDVIRTNPAACRAEEHYTMIKKFSGKPWMEQNILSKPISPIDQELASLNIPVLLYNGENDVEDFIEISNMLENILPNCTRKTIAQAGGFPLWEFPEDVNKMVKSFLNGF